jgi:hypothetical protein
MLQIIDSTGKARNVKKAKIAIHTIPDAQGIDQSVKCVEFEVIGKNGTWPSYMTLEEFNMRNANVDKSELGIKE